MSWGGPLKFLANAGLLTLAIAYACGHATAATFTAVPPTDTAAPTTVPGNSCQDYENQLSAGGAAGHPGFCQFNTGTVIVVNGMELNQFWQAVSAGAVPPPFQVTYSTRYPLQTCATVKNLSVNVSLQIQGSRLDWPGASSIGAACLAEWNRRSPANLTAVSASGATARLVGFLQKELPHTIQVCKSIKHYSQKQAVADLAPLLRNYMSSTANRIRSWWSLPGTSGQDCVLHCNVCSSGWAGTITVKRHFSTAASPNFFNETDTYYVGGASSVANNITAEWTASGTGDYSASGTKLHWDLSADAPIGLCKTTNVVCFEPVSHPSNITFTETNQAASIGGGVVYTYNGQSPPPAPASETQIYPAITTKLPTDTTADDTQHDSTCYITIPITGVYGSTCTQDWEWHLVKQP